ncbi:MAG: cysteine desulfurase [Gammaproteobacteria bacterium]|nr:cysteine desulfurase [Gammaproteobacteria bacterium]
MSSPIYLDNNSTTPVDPVVFEAMQPYFTEFCGNPSNQHHSAGSKAARAVEKARSHVAAAIDAEPDSIVFTSGATESNNLAILGVCRAIRTSPGHIITSAIEHKAVIEPFRYLERAGWKVTFLRPDSQGIVDWQAVEDAITLETVLVSIMAANNEVGTIQPVERIGEVCDRHSVMFHCDAAQALGRIPIDVGQWNVDLLSLSAHKAYGPKGTGALFVREKVKADILAPISFGGGQESGIRPGTLAVPNIVGFGVACELATSSLAAETTRLRMLRQSLLAKLRSCCPDMVVHGHPMHSLPGLLSVAFPGVDGDQFLFAIRDVAISQGSACTAGSPEPSHVLTALGVGYELARSSFRFGIGRFTTPEDIEAAATEVARVLAILR